jgi:hypothetical protein
MSEDEGTQGSAMGPSYSPCNHLIIFPVIDRQAPVAGVRLSPPRFCTPDVALDPTGPSCLPELRPSFYIFPRSCRPNAHKYQASFRSFSDGTFFPRTSINPTPGEETRDVAQYHSPRVHGADLLHSSRNSEVIHADLISPASSVAAPAPDRSVYTGLHYPPESLKTPDPRPASSLLRCSRYYPED